MSREREKEIFQPFGGYVVNTLQNIKKSVEYAIDQFEDAREHVSDYGEDFSASLDAVKLHLDNAESVISADDAITPKNVQQVECELELARAILSDAVNNQVDNENGMVHEDVEYFIDNHVYSIDDEIQELSDKISVLHEYKALSDSLANERFSVMTGNDGETYIFSDDMETAEKALLKNTIEFMFEFEMDEEDPASVNRVLKDMQNLKIEVNALQNEQREDSERTLFHEKEWDPAWENMKMFRGTVLMDVSMEKQQARDTGMSM